MCLTLAFIIEARRNTTRLYLSMCTQQGQSNMAWCEETVQSRIWITSENNVKIIFKEKWLLALLFCRDMGVQTRSHIASHHILVENALMTLAYLVWHTQPFRTWPSPASLVLSHHFCDPWCSSLFCILSCLSVIAQASTLFLDHTPFLFIHLSGKFFDLIQD